MARHVRVFWGPFWGRVFLNFNWPGVINSKSVVHISVSEALLNRPGHSLEDNINRFVDRGYVDSRNLFQPGALISVHNISPHDIGVTFVVVVNAPNYNERYFTTDITVFDNLPEEYIWVNR
jgi:hypothetical protein